MPRKDFLHPLQSVIGVVERRETFEREREQSRSGVGGEQRRERAGSGKSTVPGHKRG
jgi:hypothetical protein